MIKFRMYMDKDAEQEWIMSMVEKGWAFQNFCAGFYQFEKCEPGEYIYQIDLLDSFCKNEDEFMEFMEEAHVEVVARWFKWVFLRKKASDGAFEMYTDTESKIDLYRRIKSMFTKVGILEIAIFIYELVGSFMTRSPLLIGAAIFIGLIVLVFLKMIWKCQWKIEELKRQ